MKEKELREIPKEEQPYELPEGWKWVQGISVFKPMESTSPSNKTFRYIDIDSIDNEKREVRQSKTMETEHAPSRAKRKLHMGDTIFSLVRPYLNNIAYIDDGLSDCIASTGFFVCTPKGDIDSKYTYWMMVNPEVVAGLTTLMKGDNSPSIRAKDIYSYLFPLPPIDEQRRIVACIERLFAHLDAAEQKVRQVREASTRRQQSLLHQAFHGELTKKWREAHGTTPLKEIPDIPQEEQPYKLPKGWQWGRMSDVVSEEKEKTDNFLDYNYYVGLEDMDKDGGVIHYSNVGKIKSMKSIFHKGQILYGKLRPYLNKHGVAESEGICSTDIIVLGTKKNSVPYFVNYYLGVPEFISYAVNHSKGTNLPRLSPKVFMKIHFPIPPLAEQHEIVRCLDGLMTHERRIASACDTALRQIEALRTTILARAFRGKH